MVWVSKVAWIEYLNCNIRNIIFMYLYNEQSLFKDWYTFYVYIPHANKLSLKVKSLTAIIFPAIIQQPMFDNHPII